MKNQIITIALVLLQATAFAQNENKINELRLNLNTDGSHFVKATFANQTWVRLTDTNPGSTLDGYDVKNLFDIGLRRTRFQLFGKVHDRVFFYTQIGQNNLSFNTARKAGLFVHDALGEIELAKDVVSVGAGLAAWSGLSRFASPSIANQLAFDAPLYQQATNDVTDQFLRKYSVYAKGKIKKLDYRLAVSKPMTLKNSTVQDISISENSKFAPTPPKPQLQGYFMLQLKDQESNLTPYNSGTYLGKKDILTVGAGFVTQKDAMWHQEGTQTRFEDMKLWSADVFYERPLNKAQGNALTVYAAFSVTDFGKNYVRNLGVMNPTNGVNATASFNGAGNAFPMVGTGSTLFAQAGYLFSKDLLGKMGTLQPYADVQYSRFDLLKDPMAMYEAGLNWLIDGQRAKVSMGYQNRPVYGGDQSGGYRVTDHKGMAVAQVQVSI